MKNHEISSPTSHQTNFKIFQFSSSCEKYEFNILFGNHITIFLKLPRIFNLLDRIMRHYECKMSFESGEWMARHEPEKIENRIRVLCCHLTLVIFQLDSMSSQLVSHSRHCCWIRFPFSIFDVFVMEMSEFVRTVCRWSFDILNTKLFTASWCFIFIAGWQRS